MLHTRIVNLTTDAGGSAAGTVSVPPARFAGTYYQFTPDHAVDITIASLGREVFSKSGTSNSDGVQEFLLTQEKLVSGNVVVATSGGSAGAGDKAVVQLYFDY